MGVLAWFALLCCTVFTALHLATIAVVFRRLGRTPALARLGEMPAITLIRPICGLENNLEATLRSTFRLDARELEILFCVADADDAAVHLVRSLISEYPEVNARLLIGEDRISANPKLNNLAKGWATAKHDWIGMADSNLMLPRSYLRQLVGTWTPGTGLVSSPAVGTDPQCLWGEVEAAFLNSHQARWQLFADEIGQGYAQGKTLFWRRDILEAGGGPAALGQEMAEDVASTKLVRGKGLKVRLARAAFPQPLGRRSLIEVWSRQVRWARVRRLGMVRLYSGEIVSGGMPAITALAVAVAAGALHWAVFPVFATLWYGAEIGVSVRAGWPHGVRASLALVVRDLMIPAIWIAGWTGSGFTWRGNAMCSGSPTRPVEALG